MAIHHPDLRTRLLRTLLEFDAEALVRKSAAATIVGVLADVTGELCSVILKENGEATFNDCLANIVARIEKAARASASAPPAPLSSSLPN
jgi:hypothetical protein